MSERQDLRARAHKLSAQGLTSAAIGFQLDVPGSTVRNWLNGRRCIDCDAWLDGSKGQKCERCESCRHAYERSDEHRAALTWTRERIVAAIHDFVAETGEPPATPDWGPSLAARLGDSARTRRGEIAIAERRWPWFTLVVRRFGSWNAAIEAAGYTPRTPGGGGGNERRRRTYRSLQATVSG